MIIGIDASRTNAVQKTGTEYYSASLIEWLAKIDNFITRSGKENQYILYAPRHLAGDLANLPANFNEKIIPFPHLWTHLRLSLEMIRNRPDVLFIPAHVLPLIHPDRSVVTIHDVAFNYFPDAYSDRERHYLDWSTKYALTHAKKIIAISESTKRDLIKFYHAEESKIKVIYNGYDDLFSSFRPEPAIFAGHKKRLGITKDYLLFIGRIEKRKNIENIIRAFTFVCEAGADLQLILAGKTGFGSMEIFRMIESCPHRDRIILPGYVSEEDSLYLMHNATIFLFPTLYEGFGLPVLEAMAAGTPVITSNRSSLPEVAGDAALIIDPLKPEEIAKAVVRLLTDLHLVEDLILRGKKRASAFSWEKCASETLSLLEDI